MPKKQNTTKPVLTTATLKSVSKTPQHGSAAALELIVELERINAPHFGKPEVREKTDEMLRAHFEAFHNANAASKRGFLRVFGDWVASAAAGCTASEPAEFYSGHRWLGGTLTAKQRQAQGRAWLKGGQS